MKIRLFLLLLSSVTGPSLSAQIPNFLPILESASCPYDSTVLVNRSANWDVYQTIGDRWDDPVDSSRCFSWEYSDFQLRFHLDQIDPTRPFFVRLRTDTVSLDSAQVYQMNYGSIFSRDFEDVLAYGEGCLDQCSGLFYQTAVYDAGRDSLHLREEFSPVAKARTSFYESFCITTDSYDSIRLQNLLYRFQFQPEMVDITDFIRFYSGPQLVQSNDYYYYNEINKPNYIRDITIAGSGTGVNAYDVQLSTFAETNNYFSPYLIMYPDTTFPSPDDVGYLDVKLEPNVAYPVDINLFSAYEFIHFQPFTALRPDLIAGSDSIRHHLNLMLTEDDYLCFPIIIELIMPPSSSLVFEGGNINFGSDQSCVLLNRNSALRVRNNYALHYGHNGVGALMLRKGSTIEIAAGSSLLLDNRVILMEDYPSPDRQFFMNLDPGAKLTFGPNCRLERLQKEGGGFMKFNIYMNGGTLDLQYLNADELKLINLIYPNTSEPEPIGLNLSPNPFQHDFTVGIHLDDPVPVIVEMYNTYGQRVARRRFTGVKGNQRFTFDNILHLASGVYVVEVQYAHRRETRLLIKI